MRRIFKVFADEKIYLNQEEIIEHLYFENEELKKRIEKIEKKLEKILDK